MNSLGFDKDPSKTRVVVAMSGGVDSSVVAALLSEEGYDVVGITLQLYDHGEAIHKEKACCAGKDIYDARRVAEKIGIPHYVLNYQTRFQESVIDKFADSYLRGETPIPCVLCNQTVKFVDLLKSAKDLCADALATGHYIRRTTRNGMPELHRARDVAKDQSYFLFSTTREQLEFLRFPLGDMHKNQAREHAARFGLSVAIKPDSQDICFVPDGRYAEVVKKLRPGSITPGEIVDVTGKVLGRHGGIIDFTVGQRRRLGIGGLEKPLYVLRTDPLTHQVIVGPRSALQKKSIDLTGVNWLGHPEIGTCRGEVTVKIRSTQDPIPADIKACSDKKAEAKVLFKTPELATATGQACVFYQGDRLLGGGWIR